MEKSWTRLPHAFQFAAAQFNWEVNHQRPDLGAELVDSQTRRKLARIFSVPSLAGSSMKDAEAYVRETDLIVHYPATSIQPVDVSLMWRAGDGAIGVDVLELVISIQTPLLDAQPIREVTSWFPRGKLLPFDSRSSLQFESREFEKANSMPAEHRCLVKEDDRLFLTVIHPSDLSWMSLTTELDQFVLNCRLRTDNLEKGVIRRLRMQFGTGSDLEIEAIRNVPEAFLQSELPLST
jgi:hypothetical protein